MQKVKLVVLNCHEFESRQLFLSAFLAFSAFQDSDAKNNDFFGKSASIKRLLTETLMKKLKRAVMEIGEFQHSA